MIPGYHSRAAIVDLASGTLEALALPEEILRSYLGGAGLAARLLYDHGPAGVEPLSADNQIIIAAAPFIDSGLPADARTALAAKSPLTGFIGDSMVSGDLGVALKRAGFDALVLRGACRELSVLTLNGQNVRLEPAADLAGLSPVATEARLRTTLGEHYAVAAIGVAGECRVRFASVVHHGRHAGRTGIGAVFGAKKLKAIAMAGDQHVRAADPAGIERAAADWAARAAGPATEKYRTGGTARNLGRFEALGVLPARNFQRAAFAGAAALGAAGPGGAGRRLEFESLFALGPLLGIADQLAVAHAAALCDEFGVDTISAGGTLAWAMEAVERQILSSSVVGLAGFGDAEGVLISLSRIARRSGVGDLLAEGSRRAAQRSGPGSLAWAMQAKGLELPGYEPRVLKALALALAVSPRGACHNRSSAYDLDFAGAVDGGDKDALASAVIEAEDRAALLDSLTIGKFLRRCFTDFYPEAADLLRRVTGWDVAPEDLRAAGARVNQLRKAYNVREGWTGADDWLPERLLTEPVYGGPHDGARLTPEWLRGVLDSYYRHRGWNARGAPRR